MKTFVAFEFVVLIATAIVIAVVIELVEGQTTKLMPNKHLF
jgi:hypothetical protein